MEIIGYAASILIGISLGLIGGGGSILTVPVLVYLFGIEPISATAYSLFIVGFTSLVGATRAYIHKLIDFKAVSLFGIPSILTIFIARHFILPALPETIFTIGTLEISKGSFLMLVFALLMSIAAVFMLRDKFINENNTQPAPANLHSPLTLLLPGLLVGLLTGLLGAGGGFLIIPALVLLIHLPMKTAVGTSLLIIAINSTFGFLFSIGHHHFRWPLLISFTLLSVTGVFIGSWLAGKISGTALKKGFGWFVLLMSLCIIIKELVEQ